MPKNKSAVDMTNLENSLNILKSKYGKLSNFKILFFGILIGATISALIQLVILPLSFDGDNLTYGNQIVANNVDMQAYLIVTVFAFCGGLVGIVFLYKRFVIGITPRVTTELNYSGDLKKIHDDLTKVLSERCPTLGGNVKTSAQ